jgi:hypothetical protein
MSTKCCNTKWIIKSPFSTNSKYYKKYVNNIEQAMGYVKSICRDMFHPKSQRCILPYVMLQERVTHNNEVKVCFLNKRYSHIASVARSVRSFPGFFTEAEIILFAHGALMSLTHLEDVLILDGLVRVDVFKSNQGILVVNELESLEADFGATNFPAVSETEHFLAEYWEQHIYECIGKLA